MRNSYTTTDLLRYFYGETSAFENRLIAQRLNTDPQLLAKYQRLANDFDLLENQLEAPSESCLKSILHKARSSERV